MLEDDVKSAFKEAMRRVASTVTIVTAQDGARHHGMTATAMTSLSADPPSLLVCINNKTLLHDILLHGEAFCVNVLHQEHVDLSAAFAGALDPAERFGRGAWSRRDGGAAFLTDAQAVLFCRKALEVAFGSHTIFIGEVLKVEFREPVAPLVYQNAAYCSATPNITE